jgi:signal transduction histidine kinase
LSQLLENACRYSVPGSAVWVKMEARGGTVEVSVSSEGDPILSPAQPSILGHPHVEVRNPSFGAGADLGLSVARKIAVAHGGTLDFDAERAGTESVAFLLSLPRAADTKKRPSEQYE